VLVLDWWVLERQRHEPPATTMRASEFALALDPPHGHILLSHCLPAGAATGSLHRMTMGLDRGPGAPIGGQDFMTGIGRVGAGAVELIRSASPPSQIPPTSVIIQSGGGRRAAPPGTAKEGERHEDWQTWNWSRGHDFRPRPGRA